MGDLNRVGDQEVRVVDAITQTSLVIDENSGALLANPLVDYQVHQGHHFYVKGYTDITGAAAYIDFLWVIADSSTHPHAAWTISANEEFTLQLYENATVSDNGSSVAVYNSNRNSSNSSVVTAYNGPTITDIGTLVWSSRIGSGKESGAFVKNYLFIGKQNSKYVFRITKVNAGTHWLDWDFYWFEQ